MVKRDYIEAGTILKYTLPTVARESLKEWADLVKEDTDHWGSNKPYPGLHDFTAIEALTPSLRHYTTEVSQHAVEKQLVGVYVAVLLKPGMGFRLANTYLTRELSRIDKNIHFQAFRNSANAILWLKEMMLTHSSESPS